MTNTEKLPNIKITHKKILFELATEATCSTYFKDIFLFCTPGTTVALQLNEKKNDYRSIALFSLLTSKEAMPLLD